MRLLDPALMMAIETEVMNPDEFEGWISLERMLDWDFVEPEELNGNALHIAFNPERRIAVAVYVSPDLSGFPARWYFSSHPVDTAMYWACEFHYLSPGDDVPAFQASGPCSEINERPKDVTLQ